MKKKNKNLKSLVSNLLFVSAIIPCIIFILVSAGALSNEATDKFKAETRFKLSTLGKISEEYNSSVETAFSIMQSDKNLVEYLENADKFDGVKDSFKTITSFMAEDMIDMGVYSLETGKFAHIDEESAVSKNIADELWVKLALKETGSLIEVSTKQQADGSVHVTYAKTLTKTVPVEGDKPKSVDIGVMYITITLDDMFQTSKNTVLTSNANVLIFDKNYKVIFDREEKLVGSTLNDKEWIGELIRCKNKKFIDIVIEGQKYIAYKENNRMNDVTIIGLVPNQDITESIKVAIKPIVVFASVIILAIIVIGYLFSKKITKPFDKIVEDIKPFKEGDFRSELKVRKEYTSEMKDIVDTLNDTRVGLSEILNNVKQASTTLEYNSTGLADISAQSYNIMDGVVQSTAAIAGDTEGNVARIGRLTDATDKLSNEITNVRSLSEEILDSSSSIADFSVGGQEIISKLKLSFDENNNITSDVINNIKEVSKVSKEINTITDSIKSITKETNLLSINASIEASKAGQAGKGFAVVADSIRSLANQSEESTKKIDAYITTIIKTIDSLEAKVSALSDINSVTANDVDKTYSHFNQIIKLIEELNAKINTVNESMKTIDENKDVVARNITEVAEASEEISLSTEEVTASIQEQSAQLQEITSSTVVLSKLASELQDLLSKFKTTDAE